MYFMKTKKELTLHFRKMMTPETMMITAPARTPTMTPISTAGPSEGFGAADSSGRVGGMWTAAEGRSGWN